MRHALKGRKLNRTSAHREAMLSNMVTSLFRHERIRTTHPKAKEARRMAERLITRAKGGTLHARRLVHRVIRDNEVLGKLFAELAPRYKERNGGYTRILKLGRRAGDNAPMSILELVDRVETTPAAEEPKAEAHDHADHEGHEHAEEKPKAKRAKKAPKAEAAPEAAEAEKKPAKKSKKKAE